MKLNLHEQINELLDGESKEDKQAIINNLADSTFDPDTIVKIAQIIREKSDKVIDDFTDTIDIVSTGGSNCKTLNYSILSSLIVRKLGGHVAKHGCNIADHDCDSFDFLSHLNIELPKNKDDAFKELTENGIVFLFAAHFNKFFKYFYDLKIKKETTDKKIINFFNILAPLVNPANVKKIIIGVHDKKLLNFYPKVLPKLGFTHAYIVYCDEIDEFTTSGVNQVVQIINGEANYFSLHPEQLGFVRAKQKYLEANSANDNFEESCMIIKNELFGPKQDTLIMNAAAAVHLSRSFDGKLKDIVNEIKDAIKNDDFADILDDIIEK